MRDVIFVSASLSCCFLGEHALADNHPATTADFKPHIVCDQASGLGNLDARIPLAGAERFLVGAKTDDIYLVLHEVGRARIVVSDTTASTSVGSWKLTVSLETLPFTEAPDGTEDIDRIAGWGEPDNYVSELYRPINDALPPLALEIQGETNDCTATLPEWSVQLERNDRAISRYTIDFTLDKSVKRSVDMTRFFLSLRDLYAGSYSYYFGLPADFLGSERFRADSETGFLSQFRQPTDIAHFYERLYYRPNVEDTIGSDETLHIEKLGTVCLNLEGSLLKVFPDEEHTISLTFGAQNALEMAKERRVKPPLPETLERRDDGTLFFRSFPGSLREASLIHLAKHEFKFFGPDRQFEQELKADIDRYFWVDLDEIDNQILSIRNQYYANRGLQRIERKYNCFDK